MWRGGFAASTFDDPPTKDQLPPFTSITPLYDLPPDTHEFSSHTVNFSPQRTFHQFHEEYKPRSLSAEPRRPRRPYTEEHHDDASPFVLVPNNSVAASTSSRFPSSSHREKREVEELLAVHSVPSDSLTPPSLSPSSPFSSPSTRPLQQQPSAVSGGGQNSSSALLNLLRGFPTASPVASAGPKKQPFEEHFYQNFDARPFHAQQGRWPEELSPPSSWNNTSRTSFLPLPAEFLSPVPTESSLNSVSFHTDSRSSPQFSNSETPTPSAAVLLARLRESDIGPSPPSSTPTPTPRTQTLNRSFYDSDAPYPHRSLSSPQHFLDISSLDRLLSGGSQEDMSRTSNEWRSSFAAMRDRYSQKDGDPPPLLQFAGAGYADGSQTLPRRMNMLTKSSSHHDMQRVLPEPSKRAAEAPEFRPLANREFGNFWTNTVKNRPASPPIQRIPASLTAAERLELLHESPDGSPRGMTPPPRKGGGENLAARRAQFLKETFRPENYRSSVSQPVHVNVGEERQPNPPITNHRYTNGGPNFATLDRAVEEMTSRAEGKVVFDTRKSAGLNRFPTTESFSLSPPSTVPTRRPNQAHSPSPDTISEASSSYQMPTGLPHPKPKHNIKEQLLHVGYQSIPVRAHGRSAPNFPVPTTGSVASRISELEKRPGTPTLLMAGGQAYGLTAPPVVSPGPMSPRSTVYRTKSVIHTDIGQARSPRSLATAASLGDVFEFPPSIRLHNAAAVSEPSLPDATSVVGRSAKASAAAEFQLSSTPAQRSASATATKLDRYSATASTAATAESPSPKTVNGGSWVDETSSRVGRLSSNSIASAASPTTKLNDVSQRADGYPLAKSTVTVTAVDKTRKPGEPAVIANGSVRAGRIVTESPIAKLEPDFYVDVQTSPRHHLPHSLPRPRPSLHRSAVNLPRFHYPKGRPVSSLENDAALRRVADVFLRLPNQEATLLNMPSVCTAAGLPVYWKRPVLDAVCGQQTGRPIVFSEFAQYWKSMTTVAHDEASRFVWTLTGGSRETLLRKHFDGMILDIIHSHPGLTFYREAEEFHQKYVQAVVTRIFWKANRSWTGRLTVAELRRCSFLESVRQLQDVDDINKFTDYFSYEHFYVLYCKFWEIDKDHILQITRHDLAAYNEGALTPLVIERVFSGAVTRTASEESGERPRRLDTIGFPEFVSLLLADEDKHNPTSIEYWFRIMDLDGDGMISLYEMDLFYEQIVAKLDECSIETMKFTDVACNLIDMIKPKSNTGFTLSDLRKSPLAPRFFNSFVNWKKFFQQETNEGERPSVRTDGGEELSDWDRFCAEEYEGMIAEGDEDDVDENISVNLDEDESGRPLMHNLL